MSARKWLLVGGLALGEARCGASPAPYASPANVTVVANSVPVRDGANSLDRSPTMVEVATQSAHQSLAATITNAVPTTGASIPSDPVPVKPAGEDDGLFGDQASREPPWEVERELAHIQAAYQELPALVTLPDFLSVNDVLALLPLDDRDYMREELHSQFQNRNGGRILGAYLDSDERFFMLWVPDPVGLAAVLTIYDAKGVTIERKHISRGRPLLRDILALESAALVSRGYTAREVFIERITTMSVCCLPRSFEVYALTSGGKLRKVLDHPRSHTDVGPGVRWGFLNHFEFVGTRLWVSSVLDADSKSVQAFEYRATAGRYVPLLEGPPGAKPAPSPVPFEH